MTDVKFPQDFYCDDVGVWRLKKEKLAELEKPKPMTNEEYLRSCTTEQLAKAILFFCPSPCEICENPCDDGDACTYNIALNTVVEWLKQPHKDGES